MWPQWYGAFLKPGRLSLRDASIRAKKGVLSSGKGGVFGVWKVRNGQEEKVEACGACLDEVFGGILGMGVGQKYRVPKKKRFGKRKQIFQNMMSLYRVSFLTPVAIFLI